MLFMRAASGVQSAGSGKAQADFRVLSASSRISSVSGGSIIAGLLGMNWKDLDTQPNVESRRFQDLIIGPIRQTGKTIGELLSLGNVWLTLYLGKFRCPPDGGHYRIAVFACLHSLHRAL